MWSLPRWNLTSLYEDDKKWKEDINYLYSTLIKSYYDRNVVVTLDTVELYRKTKDYFTLKEILENDSDCQECKRKLSIVNKIIELSNNKRNISLSDKNKYMNEYFIITTQINSQISMSSDALLSSNKLVRSSYYTKIMAEFKKESESLESLFISFFNKIEPNTISNDIIEIGEKLRTSTNNNLHLYQQSLNQKAMMMKQEELNIYDLNYYYHSYPDINFLEAFSKIKESLKLIGYNFVEDFEKLIVQGKIDLSQSNKKNPFPLCIQLLNNDSYISLSYENNIDDVFALIHEVGHCISNQARSLMPDVNIKNQTLKVIDEIFAITLELILLRIELNKSDRREFFLEYFVELYRENIFSQIMYHEFEEYCTQVFLEDKKNLSVFYFSLIKKYHGEKHVNDKRESLGYLRTPHYFNSYYCIQYSIAFIISLKISKLVVDNNRGEQLKKAITKQLEFRTLNCFLKFWDLETSELTNDCFNEYKEILNEIESIYERKEK
ncbi:MAG: hypothetical protein N2A99_04625 [Carnobacterium alterfunditum]